MRFLHSMALGALAVGGLLTVFALAQPAKAPRPNADDLKKIEAALPDKAPATPKKPRKLLIFTKATGFVHSSIPVGAKTFELMGKKTGAFDTVITDDVEAFDAANLAKFDAILFLSTTGELFVNKGQNADLLRDANAPLPPELQHSKVLRQNLLDFVKGGKGIAGLHAAGDSSYKWKEYGEMMGGYFNGHPWGKITVFFDDPTNPVNAAFDGKPFEIQDEIYTFRDPYSRDRLHILLSIDVAASKLDQGFNRKDHDYGVSWLNKYGEGRAFYCSLGHREETYFNPTVLKHYLAGIQYAMGDLAADDKPSGPFSPERTAAGAQLAAVAWQNVCNNEQWYKDHKAKEQMFAGTLEAVPNAGGPSTLMRTAFYKLGDRKVFTGGKKNAVLDKLVGQKVEIKGKAYDINLEGQAVSEVWPAQVRPGK